MHRAGTRLDSDTVGSQFVSREGDLPASGVLLRSRRPLHHHRHDSGAAAERWAERLLVILAPQTKDRLSFQLLDFRFHGEAGGGVVHPIADVKLELHGRAGAEQREQADMRSELGRQPADHGRQDVGAALAAMALSSVLGPINVCSGEPVTVREIIEALGRTAGRPELIAIGSRPYAQGDPMVVYGDNRRLREEVGWTPRITLGDGIERTWDWWKRSASAGSVLEAR